MQTVHHTVHGEAAKEATGAFLRPVGFISPSLSPLFLCLCFCLYIAMSRMAGQHSSLTELRCSFLFLSFFVISLSLSLFSWCTCMRSQWTSLKEQCSNHRRLLFSLQAPPPRPLSLLSVIQSASCSCAVSPRSFLFSSILPFAQLIDCSKRQKRDVRVPTRKRRTKSSSLLHKTHASKEKSLSSFRLSPFDEHNRQTSLQLQAKHMRRNQMHVRISHTETEETSRTYMHSSPYATFVAVTIRRLSPVIVGSMDSFIHSFGLSLIHSFGHSFIHSFGLSFIRSVFH